MPFESESKMKYVASQVLAESFRRGPVEVIPEFDYGPGRADLVFTDISNKYIKYRTTELGIKESIDTKSRLQVFLQLHGKKPITEEYFYEIGAINRRKKKKNLHWLINNGFVVWQENKLFTAPNLRCHVTTAISVELKLSKWKQALKQAKRGRSFANYRYVALDADKASPAVRAIKEFKEDNVGLILLDSSGSVEVKNHPSRINPYSDLNRWKLNESTLSTPSVNIAGD